MNERTHLIKDYLCRNSTIINWGYYAMSEDDLSKALHQLKSFDRPDMYAILEDKIIIIEHFEFDATVCSRKGMKGIKEGRLLDYRISSAPIDSKLHVDKGNYTISLANWQTNFEMTFDSHYNKIPAYKKAVRNREDISFDKPIVVGFFIENQYSPIVYNHRTPKRHEELYYFETAQFVSKISDSPDLDFILFGSYCNGMPQIFYIDRESYKHIGESTDLEDSDLHLSPLNKSEITVHGKFYCSNSMWKPKSLSSLRQKLEVRYEKSDFNWKWSYLSTNTHVS